MHYTVRTPKVFLLSVWPLPRSLATTGGISVDFSSSPYLDVSVQAVPLIRLWIQRMMTRLTYSSPWLFAVSHVLHRLSVPRHSPCALCSLTIFKSSSYRTLDQIRPLFNVLALTANVLRFCAARFLLFELKQIKL